MYDIGSASDINMSCKQCHSAILLQLILSNEYINFSDQLCPESTATALVKYLGTEVAGLLETYMVLPRAEV